MEFKHQSLFGELAVRWDKMEGKIIYQISIPHGMNVELGEDAMLCRQGGCTVKAVAGTQVGSGSWKIIF